MNKGQNGQWKTNNLVPGLTPRFLDLKISTPEIELTEKQRFNFETSNTSHPALFSTSSLSM